MAGLSCRLLASVLLILLFIDVPSCSAGLFSSDPRMQLDGAAQRAVSRYFEWTESQRSVAKSMVVERARAGELELAPKWGDEELGAEDEDRIVDEKTRGELAGKMELRDLGVLDDMQELLLQLGYWDDEEGLQRIARMLKRGEQGRHNDFVDRKGWESDAMLIAELTDIAQLQTALIRVQQRLDDIAEEREGKRSEAMGETVPIKMFDLTSLNTFAAAYPGFEESADEDESREDEDEEDDDGGRGKLRSSKMDDREKKVGSHRRRLNYLKNPFDLGQVEQAVPDSDSGAHEDEEHPLMNLPDAVFKTALIHSGMTNEDFECNFSNTLLPGTGSPFHPCVERRHDALIGKTRQVPDRRDSRTADQDGVVNYYLHKACGLGDLGDVQALLGIGATVTSVDENWGDTALHEACGNAKTAVVSLLLSLGADPAAKTNEGWTPLHMAASRGASDIIRLLLATRARDDVNALTCNGYTALDVAQGYGYDSPHEAGRVLRDAGGFIAPDVGDWREKMVKEEEGFEAQRERIWEESQHKTNEVTGSFRPVGWSLTQALCQRDTRDPNRNGHRKRSMMDSMDLLKFRRLQVERSIPEEYTDTNLAAMKLGEKRGDDYDTE